MWTTPTHANIDPNAPAVSEVRAMTFLKSLPREWSHSSGGLLCRLQQQQPPF